MLLYSHMGRDSLLGGGHRDSPPEVKNFFLLSSSLVANFRAPEATSEHVNCIQTPWSMGGVYIM